MKNDIELELDYWLCRKEELKALGSELRREREILESKLNNASKLKDAHILTPEVRQMMEAQAKATGMLEKLRVEYTDVSQRIELYAKLRWLAPVQVPLTIEDHSQDIVEPEKQERSSPRLATFLISQLIPKSHEDGVLGDLEEEFSERCLRCGYKKAKLWYYRQAISTVRLYLNQFFKKVLKIGS